MKVKLFKQIAIYFKSIINYLNYEIMKTIKFSSLILALVMVLFSCSNDNEPIMKVNSTVDSSAVIQKAASVSTFLTVAPDKIIYQEGNTAIFSGKLTNSFGLGISGVQIGIDNSVSQMCTLSSKTDLNGKFVYAVNLSSKKGIYSFGFYYGNSKFYSAIAVVPSSGLKLTNYSNSIPLGSSTSVSSFDYSTLIKTGSNFSQATQSQLTNSSNNMLTFIGAVGKDYFSNPSTKVITISAVACTAATVWNGTIAACYPLYEIVGVELGKSIIITAAKTSIDKSGMTSSEKTLWKNKVDVGNCLISTVALNPATSVLSAVDAFGAGWTCGSALASYTTDSKNVKSLKIIVTPTSSSSKQSVGGFVITPR